jgi:hypothetical protein
VSNDDFCCPYPLWAYCACDSPITGGQVAGCCMPGVDCPQDLPAWDDHQYAGNEYYGPCVEDGVVICCCETEECDWTGYITLDCKVS